MNIFVSGLAGVGKTTFINKVSTELGLERKKELIRQKDELLKLSICERQQKYFDLYLEVHKQDGDFISDRTAVDILCWLPEAIEYDNAIEKLKQVKKPDLVIIPPVPHYRFIDTNSKIWIDDPVRYKTFSEKFVFMNSKTDFLVNLYSSFVAEYSTLVRTYQLLDWPCHLPQKDWFNDSSEYYSWQKESFSLIERTLYEKGREEI
jgi:adenylate kinase family enzyme